MQEQTANVAGETFLSHETWTGLSALSSEVWSVDANDPVTGARWRFASSLWLLAIPR
jgi:hypothetical protein